MFNQNGLGPEPSYSVKQELEKPATLKAVTQSDAEHRKESKLSNKPENEEPPGVIDIDSGRNIPLTTNTVKPDDLFGILGDIGLGFSANSTRDTPANRYYEQVSDNQTRLAFKIYTETHLTREATVTGTSSYMAQALLDGSATQHEPTHDLESFIWSLSYCVLHYLWVRLETNTTPDAQALRVTISKDEKLDFLRIFYNTFSDGDDLRDIAIHRSAKSVALTFVNLPEIKRIVEAFVPQPLVTLFSALSMMVDDAQALREERRIPLSHDMLLEVFEETIGSSDSDISPLDEDSVFWAS